MELQPYGLGAVSREESAMQRQRSMPATFDNKIAAEKTRLEAQAAKLRHGPEKEMLLRKLRQLETASHMSEWLKSPGLAPPK